MADEYLTRRAHDQLDHSGFLGIGNGVPGPQGPKGDPGSPGPQGAPGAGGGLPFYNDDGTYTQYMVDNSGNFILGVTKNAGAVQGGQLTLGKDGFIEFSAPDGFEVDALNGGGIFFEDTGAGGTFFDDPDGGGIFFSLGSAGGFFINDLDGGGVFIQSNYPGGIFLGMGVSGLGFSVEKSFGGSYQMLLEAPQIVNRGMNAIPFDPTSDLIDGDFALWYDSVANVVHASTRDNAAILQDIILGSLGGLPIITSDGTWTYKVEASGGYLTLTSTDGGGFGGGAQLSVGPGGGWLSASDIQINSEGGVLYLYGGQLSSQPVGFAVSAAGIFISTIALPSTDPGNSGQLWLDASNFLKVSP